MESSDDDQCSDEKQFKRLSILVCYSADGHFNRYLYFLVKELMSVSNRLITVINGQIDSAFITFLNDTGSECVQRDNSGFDMGAWKHVLTQVLSKEDIDQYDELLLTNDTYYGPFYHFSEIFKKMDEEEVDFWGMSAHGKEKNPWKVSSDSIFPEHIQTYFIAIRKRMLHSQEFMEYWTKIGTYNTFEEVVSYCEVKFTKYFSDLGFTWTTYISKLRGSDEIKDYNEYVLDPISMLSDGFPLLKKKSYSAENDYMLFTNGDVIRKSIDYIINNTDYDVSMIYEDAIHRSSIYNLYKNFGLNFIIDESQNIGEIETDRKIAVIIHIYYLDVFDDICKMIADVPKPIDVYISTDSDEKINHMKNKLGIILKDRLNFVTSKIGRDMGSLLIACKDIIRQYDYVCFTHDKKSPHCHELTGKAFRDVIIDNVIRSSGYMRGVIDVFENNPHIGLLTTPMPRMGSFYTMVGNEWVSDFEGTVELCERMNVNVDIRRDEPPLSVGTSFWFRPDALKDYFEVNWSDEIDINPLPIDGTIVHCIERSFSFVAQKNGYYTGSIQTKEYGELEIIRLQVLLTKKPEIKYGIKDSFKLFCKSVVDKTKK